MLLALQVLLSRLNPNAVRIVAYVLAGVLALMLAVGCFRYGGARLARWHLGRAQTKAEVTHTQRSNRTASRQTAYQLDSTRRATERRQHLLTDSTLAAQDAHLSTTRPARMELPASPQPGN
jgi:hypothetical protein